MPTQTPAHRSRFLALLLCVALPFMARLCFAPATAGAEDRQVVLTFAGDCVLGGNLYQNEKDSADNFINTVRANGYAYPFSGLSAVFLHDDITVVNLEGTFYDSTKGVVEKGVNFRGPTDFTEILLAGGVDAVGIANNHIADFGKRGHDATTAALTQAAIPFFGTTEYDSFTWIYADGDIRIGFTGSSRGTRYGNEEALARSFAALKAQGCDPIIVSMHAGGEYIYKRHETQEMLADYYIRHGADIIVGHHPHVVQGIEQRGGATVLYSVGNCAFGGNHAPTVYGAYLAQFTLHFSDGKYTGHQLNILPIHTSGRQPGNDFRPVLVSGDDAQRVIDQIQRDTAFPLNPYVDGVGAVQPFVPARAR